MKISCGLVVCKIIFGNTKDNQDHEEQVLTENGRYYVTLLA